MLSVIVSLARGAYSTVPTLYGGAPRLASYFTWGSSNSPSTILFRRGPWLTVGGTYLRVSRRRRLGHDLNGASSGYDDRLSFRFCGGKDRVGRSGERAVLTSHRLGQIVERGDAAVLGLTFALVARLRPFHSLIMK